MQTTNPNMAQNSVDHKMSYANYTHFMLTRDRKSLYSSISFKAWFAKKSTSVSLKGGRW